MASDTGGLGTRTGDAPGELGLGSRDPQSNARLIASDRVEGTAVRRSNGDKVGSIERLMIEKTSGKVAYAVMSFGGFLGLGEDFYTLPWSTLAYNTELDAYEVNLTDEQLRGAPRRSESGIDTRTDPSFDRDWEEHVHRYYNATPYWGI